MIRQLTADLAVPSQCYLAEGPVWDPGRPPDLFAA